MDAAVTVENFSLTFERVFNAPRQAVYEAWTQKEALTQWFAPTKEMSTIMHEMELKVGGQYRVEMLEPDGTSHMTRGEYVVLNPFVQIAFTWLWESDEMEVDSLVTIDLIEQGDATKMILTHDKLGSQRSVDLHNEGWSGCIEQLGHYIG